MLKKISNSKKLKLIKKYNNPKTLYEKNKKELEENIFLNETEINEIVEYNKKQNLKYYIDYMEKNKINIITIFDTEYPENLKILYDKPLYLYFKGNIDLLREGGIAVVGARNCSNYGKNIAEKFAYNIAKSDKCIISGLAKGIDKCSHIGALKAKGKTIAVIGNGLDDIYPNENKELANQIVNNGGLVISEYVIGTKPEKMNFPERNRIISALADGILVVEATKKSGSLITVDFGLDQGKEIFAIPGNINCINSIGTNELIKQGANLVTEYKDIMDICYG